jgi:hypothetical protein
MNMENLFIISTPNRGSEGVNSLATKRANSIENQLI